MLPANPVEQLRLAHAIACHAYAGRVSALEGEVGRLRRAAADRASHVRTLETRLTSLQLELQDALDKARALPGSRDRGCLRGLGSRGRGTCARWRRA